MESLRNDVLSIILEFVGQYHFRFVAAVNRSFRDTHVKAIPYSRGRQTSCEVGVASVSCAHIMTNDLKQKDILFQWERQANNVAASRGRLNILKNGLSQSYPSTWEDIAEKAAMKGHIHWVRDCQGGEFLEHCEVCSARASEGRIAVLEWGRRHG